MASTTTIKRYNSSGVFEDVKVWYYTSEGKVPVSSVKRWNGSIWEQVSKTPITFEYNGTYTQSEVTINGVVHDLYTLTKSGTLTLGKDAKYWMCGGGAKGAGYAHTFNYMANPQVEGYGSGGGGGGGYIKSGTITAGTSIITIGGGNSGASKIGTITANGGNSGTVLTAYDSSKTTEAGRGGNGGSGGGGGGSTMYSEFIGGGGSGSGVSTYPFGLTSLSAHCAGGGGGSLYGNYSVHGGTGGSNGASGSAGTTGGWNYDADYPGSVAGGSRGGGASGWMKYPAASSPTIGHASSGSFYGAGGGGGFTYRNSPSFTSNAGSGYQGVVYIAIPKS